MLPVLACMIHCATGLNLLNKLSNIKVWRFSKWRLQNTKPSTVPHRTAQFACPWSWPRAQCFSRGSSWCVRWSSSTLCRIFNIPGPWALHATLTKMPSKRSYWTPGVYSTVCSWEPWSLQIQKRSCTVFASDSQAGKNNRVEFKRFQKSHTWENYGDLFPMVRKTILSALVMKQVFGMKV